MSVGYTKILLLQNDMTLDVSRTISTYVYEIGILGGQYGYAAAIDLFNSVINIALLILFNWICKKLTDISLF